VSFRDIPQIAGMVEYPIWGERELDQLYDNLRINIPELMIITGAPGSGKSSWALNICGVLAEKYGFKGAILQFEDQPMRNFEDLVRFRLRTIKKPTDEDIAKAQIWAEEMFRTIAPEETLGEGEDYTFKWLRDAIWEAVKRHGAMWVLIDPWNEI